MNLVPLDKDISAPFAANKQIAQQMDRHLILNA
jgi:hypothetical protein